MESPTLVLVVLFAGLLLAGCTSSQPSKPQQSSSSITIIGSSVAEQVALQTAAGQSFSSRHPGAAIMESAFTLESFRTAYGEVQAQCGPIPLKPYVQVTMRSLGEALFVLVDVEKRVAACSSAQQRASSPPAPLLEDPAALSGCLPALYPYSDEAQVFSRQLYYDALALRFCKCASNYERETSGFRYQQVLSNDPGTARAAEAANESLKRAKNALAEVSYAIAKNNASKLKATALGAKAELQAFSEAYADFLRESCPVQLAWADQLAR